MTSASRYSDTAAKEAVPENAGTAAPAGGATLSNLPQRRPPLGNSCWLHGKQPGQGQASVIAAHAALKQVLAHGNSDLYRELGGALLGQAYQFEGRVFVTVAAALPAVSQDHGPVHFKFDADSWTQLQRDRAAQYPDLDIVGWYHTHPDLGVFYSVDDVVVHSAAFTLPWHIGLVFDPVRDEASFFGWSEGALVPLNGFYEQHENQAESAVPWRVVPTTVDDHRVDAAVPQASRHQVYSPGPASFSLAAPLGLVVGAVGLLLSFFLLVAWIVPLNRQIDRLQGVVMTMADEVMADDQLAACPDSRLRILSPLTGSKMRVGGKVALVGTAAVPSADRYRIEVRPASGDRWLLADVRRRDTDLGQLGVWDTSEYSPMAYELRLTAVDRNNVLLAEDARCVIELDLVQ